MPPPVIGQDTLEQVLAHPAVVKALQDRGRRVLLIAQREAYRAGRVHFGDSLTLTTGVRPGTKADGFRRPYVRIGAALTAEQHAEDSRRAKQSRTIILRMAARG